MSHFSSSPLSLDLFLAKALADLGIATVSPRPDPRVGELETQVADLNTLLELKEHEVGFNPLTISSQLHLPAQPNPINFN